MSDESKQRYLPCVHVFCSSACGVVKATLSADATCDKTFKQCAAYNNEKHFGGQSLWTAAPGQIADYTLHAGLPDRAAELRESAKPHQRVHCKLCAFEGVLGTVLCNGHLEGFQYACKLLQQTKHEALAKLLAQAIGQDVAAMPAVPEPFAHDGGGPRGCEPELPTITQIAGAMKGLREELDDLRRERDEWVQDFNLACDERDEAKRDEDFWLRERLDLKAHITNVGDALDAAIERAEKAERERDELREAMAERGRVSDDIQEQRERLVAHMLGMGWAKHGSEFPEDAAIRILREQKAENEKLRGDVSILKECHAQSEKERCPAKKGG